jgi:hypothetical protein
MKPTLVKDRTHCPKGHDLRIHGYYFGTNQRCRACNRRAVSEEHSGLKNQISEERVITSARDEIAKSALTGNDVNDLVPLLL